MQGPRNLCCKPGKKNQQVSKKYIRAVTTRDYSTMGNPIYDASIKKEKPETISEIVPLT